MTTGGFQQPPTELRAPSGSPAETQPGRAYFDLIGGLSAEAHLETADLGHGAASVDLTSAAADGSTGTVAAINADSIELNGAVLAGTVSSANLAQVDDGITVVVTVPGGTTTGTANFVWPKAAFTATPVTSTAVVSEAGATVHADEMLTARDAAGGTVRVDITNPAPTGGLAIAVDIRAYQAPTHFGPR